MALPSTAPQRPTTPIRRFSRSQAGALSLSQRGQAGDALSHLAPVFDELADSFDALAENMAALDLISSSLDGFNESFAAFLYGLRVNAYTTDFPNAPTKMNFELDARRRKTEAESAAASEIASATDDDDDTNSKYNGHGHSFQSYGGAAEEISRIPSKSSSTRGRGRGRGGKAISSARKKEKMMQWVLTVIDTLEIRYREEQPYRSEMEQVLLLLRENPDGLRSEISKFDNRAKLRRQSHGCRFKVIATSRESPCESGIHFFAPIKTRFEDCIECELTQIMQQAEYIGTSLQARPYEASSRLSFPPKRKVETQQL